MNLSFSTNGWNVSFKEIVSLLKENKISGLEIHNPAAACFLKEKPFEKENLSKTRKMLFENGVFISCIDVTANFAAANAEYDAV